MKKSYCADHDLCSLCEPQNRYFCRMFLPDNTRVAFEESMLSMTEYICGHKEATKIHPVKGKQIKYKNRLCKDCDAMAAGRINEVSKSLRRY